jgi:hypothetical protein
MLTIWTEPPNNPHPERNPMSYTPPKLERLTGFDREGTGPIDCAVGYRQHNHHLVAIRVEGLDREALAAYLVRAVNLHEELVAALDARLVAGQHAEPNGTVERARAALAAAQPPEKQ